MAGYRISEPRGLQSCKSIILAKNTKNRPLIKRNGFKDLNRKLMILASKGSSPKMNRWLAHEIRCGKRGTTPILAVLLLRHARRVFLNTVLDLSQQSVHSNVAGVYFQGFDFA